MHRPHCSVVVVGHTGHGKSRLVDALAVVAGRRALGRPDAGRVLTTASEQRRYTIVDVAGGRRGLRGALRAAGVADLAIVVVAAQHGPQALTREHLLAVRGQGIEHVVVVIDDSAGSNDRDLIGACELELRSVMVEYGFAGDDSAVIVARHLDDALDDALDVGAAHAVLAALDAAPLPARHEDVDAVLRVVAHLTPLSRRVSASVGVGVLDRGTLHVGDELVVLGDLTAPGLAIWNTRPVPTWMTRSTTTAPARLTQIEIDHHAVDDARAGERVGLQLRFDDTQRLRVFDRRCAVVVRAGAPAPALVVRARVRWRPRPAGGPPRALVAGSEVLCWLAASSTLARIAGTASDLQTTIDSADVERDVDVVVVLAVARFAVVGSAIVLSGGTGIIADGVVTAVVVDDNARDRAVDVVEAMSGLRRRAGATAAMVGA